MNASGNIFYKDDWGTIYESIWDTVTIGGDQVIDLTTVTRQPYVWNQADTGYIQDKTVYRRGICTTTRQVIQQLENGYIVLAEGSNQEVCYFQYTFKCTDRPKDTFKYHLDNCVSADADFIVICGPRWADPGEPNDSLVEWQTENTYGDVTGTGVRQSFYFIDVWNDSAEKIDPTACAVILATPTVFALHTLSLDQLYTLTTVLLDSMTL